LRTSPKAWSVFASAGRHRLCVPAADDLGERARRAPWHPRRECARVIRLDSIARQHGRQILFADASLALFRGENVGLVGPNGGGKSTIFRMIVNEEQPDAGQIAVERGTTIGYFSQDVGEMTGKSVVGATLDGAGPVAEAAERVAQLEHAMADPARAGDLQE